MQSTTTNKDPSIKDHWSMSNNLPFLTSKQQQASIVFFTVHHSTAVSLVLPELSVAGNIFKFTHLDGTPSVHPDQWLHHVLSSSEVTIFQLHYLIKRGSFLGNPSPLISNTNPKQPLHSLLSTKSSTKLHCMAPSFPWTILEFVYIADIFLLWSAPSIFQNQAHIPP